MPEKGRVLLTTQNVWTEIGTIDATAAGADVALAASERFYSTAKLLDNVVSAEVSEDINGIEIRALLSTNDHDVDFDIWAARAEDDNLTLVATVDCIAGNQDSDGSKKFADTLTLSNTDGWPKKPKTKVAGANYMARTFFDLCGYKRVLIHGYGTFDSDCIIEVSGH